MYIYDHPLNITLVLAPFTPIITHTSYNSKIRCMLIRKPTPPPKSNHLTIQHP